MTEEVECKRIKMTEGILIIEPFYTGSHKQLIDLLESLTEDVTLVCMRGVKWHWRARTSALYCSQNIPKQTYKKLFASSVLNLAELLGLRPDLASCEKVLYFHENQLEYPVQSAKDRDYQYGYNQIISAIAADIVLFNSEYNMKSFFGRIDAFLHKQPDYKCNVLDSIQSKCSVLYFPITTDRFNDSSNNSKLHIVWPHRWEHDKDPESLFEVLYELKEKTNTFEISVLGQAYDEVPQVFEEGKTKLSEHIRHWGYVESKDEYLQILRSCDVVISTAKHEFYGIAVLESVFSGCYPLVPNRLSYPELFPTQCLYNTNRQLVKKLADFCKKPGVPRTLSSKLELDKFHWSRLRSSYDKLLSINA